jgi:outer membrane usher protein
MKYFFLETSGLNRTFLSIAIISLLTGTVPEGNANAGEQNEIFFDPLLMEGGAADQKNIDLSLFSQSDNLPDGNYETNVYLNKRFIFKRNIQFKLGANKKTIAIITPDMLYEIGVRIDAFPALAAMSGMSPVEDIGNYIPQATTSLTVSKMNLNISIPQAALQRESRGYIDPKYWDDGVPVVFSTYSYTGSKNKLDSGSGNETNNYLNLQNGLNFGPWRLRNYSTFSNDSDSSHWESIYSYIERDIKFLKSQLTLGQSYTSGEIFESVEFNGMQLRSDDNMLPESARGYAPTIRGIANSNAEITIRQNGNVIYQSYLSPGAFAIDDLYPTSFSGDLEVTVKEADGSEHKFIQPYASVPIMQRQGRLKFSLTGGKYRAFDEDDDKPEFIQATAIYGVSNLLTLYGGTQNSKNYNAGALGFGVNLGAIGSVSSDGIYAHSKLTDNTQHTGQSYRIQYSKTLDSTDTAITLAGYKYSTEGYYTFEDANRHSSSTLDSLNLNYNKKSQYQVNVIQPLWDGLSIYFSGYQRNYWGTNKTEKNLASGLTAYWGNINYAFNYTSSKYEDITDRQIGMTVSIPLDKWLPGGWANYGVTRDNNGYTRQQMGINGTVFDDSRMSYSLMQTYGQGGDTSGSNSYSSLNSSYRSQLANINAGYAWGGGYKLLNYGISGALVIHPGGITLSQPLGDSFALVDANGASGIHLVNEAGVATDWFGYAVVPSLTPYRRNQLAIDTTKLPGGVDSENTSQVVIPNKGAMTAVHFDARIGYRVLLTLKRANGQFVPFGANATQFPDNQKQIIVDEKGVVYLTGVKGKTSLLVKWGVSAEQQCQAEIEPPKEAPGKKDLIILNAVCR